MVVGITISIAYSWKIGLISIFTLPAVTLAGYLSITFIGSFDNDNVSLYS